MRRAIGFVVVVLMAASTGCATQSHRATNVGGSEDSTWVFIEQGSEGRSGIYRCVDSVDEGVVCKRAKHLDSAP